MIICYLVVCVISFEISSNSLYFSPSLSSSLWFAFCSCFYALFYIFCHVYLRDEINVCITTPPGGGGVVHFNRGAHVQNVGGLC